MDAILSDTTGIQRIRGMAGSGKTIVLARKAVELHTAHPQWNIIVTYSTRILRRQLETLIGRFYAAKNDGSKYNDEKLRIMQSWGSASSTGVYYEVCLQHGISPLNVNKANAKYGKHANLFSKMCGDLLASIKQFHKMYDCILMNSSLNPPFEMGDPLPRVLKNSYVIMILVSQAISSRHRRYPNG
mgnify:CR=1 FL=1